MRDVAKRGNAPSPLVGYRMHTSFDRGIRSQLGATPPLPKWERIVCLTELARLGKLGEGLDISGLDAALFGQRARGRALCKRPVNPAFHIGPG